MTTLGALSVCVVANQAIQTANLIQSTPSNVRGELKHLPCGLHVKQPTHNVQILATQGRNQRPRTLGFSVPNEKNKADRGSSYAFADDHNEHSKDPDVVALASSLSSQAYFYPSSEHPGNRGSLLDKLKAVHLHVLASEQCNASRLELCHRNYLVSATNLIYYLALKCLDLEKLQEDLSSVGLFNLETINSKVLASLTAGIQLLENLKSNTEKIKENTAPGMHSQKRLDQQKNEKSQYVQ